MRKNYIWNIFKKRHMAFGIMVFLLTVLDAWATYQYPKALSFIIDVAIPKKNNNQVFQMILVMALCQGISITVSLLLSYFFCKFSNHFILQIKSMLITSMFEVDGRDLAEKGNLFMSCIERDVDQIEVLASRMLSDLILRISTVIVTAVFLIQINPVIVLFLLIVYPLLIFIQTIFNRIVSEQSQKTMEDLDRENGLIKEFVTNLYEYIVLNGLEYYRRRFICNEKVFRKDVLKLNMKMELNYTVPEIISTSAFLIILAISARMVITGNMAVGQLTVIMMYTQRLFNPLASIMTVLGHLQKSKVSIKRMNQLLALLDKNDLD